MINESEIMVNALQRSAHHVFISEVLQSTPRHLFLNMVEGTSLFRPGYVRNDPGARFRNDMGLELDREKSAKKTPRALLIYNSETIPTDVSKAFFHSQRVKADAGASGSRTYVTWIRDPLNNLASLFEIAWRLKQGGAFQESVAKRAKVQHTRDTWVDHWTAAEAGKAGRVILMNRWIRNDAYRSRILESLGLAVGPRLGKTTEWGGGSSFTSHGPGDAAPSITALESRYQAFAEIPDFIEIFAHIPTVKAVDRYFEARPEMARVAEGWTALRRKANGT